MKKIVIFIVYSFSFVFAGNYEEALNYFDKNDYKKAYKYLNKAYKENDKRALYSLGYLYYYGYGVKKDYKQAVKFFLKAEKNGSSTSYGYLGYMYRNGEGVVQSDKKAVYYYELGVKNDDADSMCNLSEYYIKGWGVNKNYFKALKLVKKGHELGGSYCKKIWDKYNLASKKERHQLDYQTEKKLCMLNMNTNPNIAIKHCEYATQLKPNDNNSRFFLGISYTKLGMLEDALKEYTFLEKQLLNDKIKIGVFTQKGNVLIQQQKNNAALKYFNDALKLSKEKSISIFEATIYNGLGMVKMRNKNYDNALKYLNKALLLTSNKQLKMNIANNIGMTYLSKEQYTSSIDSLKLANKLCNEINDYIQKDLMTSNLALAYLFNNKMNEAKSYAKNSIVGAEKTNNQLALFNSYLVYSAVMEKSGKKSESNKYYEKAKKIAISIGIPLEENTGDKNFSVIKILKNIFKEKQVK